MKANYEKGGDLNQYVFDIVHSAFRDICEKEGLKGGDMSPDDDAILTSIMEKLEVLMKRYVKYNK